MSPLPPADPDWIRQASGKAWQEILLFCRTAVGISLHPRRFADEWAHGRQRALNPLGFLATSAAILVPIRHYCLKAIGVLRADGPLAWQLYESAQPFLIFIALGILCHPLLRIMGSTRRLRTTLAISLYAGGGPATVVELLFSWPLVFLLRRVTGKAQIGVLVALLAAFLVYVWTFVRALQGVHRLSWWKVLLALALAAAVNVVLIELLPIA